MGSLRVHKKAQQQPRGRRERVERESWTGLPQRPNESKSEGHLHSFVHEEISPSKCGTRGCVVRCDANHEHSGPHVSRACVADAPELERSSVRICLHLRGLNEARTLYSCGMLRFAPRVRAQRASPSVYVCSRSLLVWSGHPYSAAHGIRSSDTRDECLGYS